MSAIRQQYTVYCVLKNTYYIFFKYEAKFMFLLEITNFLRIRSLCLFTVRREILSSWAISFEVEPCLIRLQISISREVNLE